MIDYEKIKKAVMDKMNRQVGYVRINACSAEEGINAVERIAEDAQELMVKLLAFDLINIVGFKILRDAVTCYKRDCINQIETLSFWRLWDGKE